MWERDFISQHHYHYYVIERAVIIKILAFKNVCHYNNSNNNNKSNNNNTVFLKKETKWSHCFQAIDLFNLFTFFPFLSQRHLRLGNVLRLTIRPSVSVKISKSFVFFCDSLTIRTSLGPIKDGEQMKLAILKISVSQFSNDLMSRHVYISNACVFHMALLFPST